MQRPARPSSRRVAACVAASAALLAGLAITAHRADACAIAPPPDQSVSVEYEDAIIVWDEATHTEHFIRKAVFGGGATNFGFLVPTPTQPTLAEADPGLFDRLDALTAPRVKSEPRVVPFVFLALLFGGSKAGAPVAAEAVRVLDVEQVAGLDATVLEADSAGALGDWLRAHGYPFRPALVEWATPYVEKKWKITAFKLADPRIAASEPGDSGEILVLPGAVESEHAHVVRMSFTTDRPFYPYREPTDSQSGAARELRLHILAGARLDGAPESGTWEGRPEYAEPAEDAGDLRGLVAGLPGAQAPGWLTSFRDRARVRPRADLYFTRGAQAKLRPPPTIHSFDVPVPIDLLVLGGIGVALLVRRARRKRAARVEP
jgi:hypothetical protein